MTRDTRMMSGIILITIPTIQYGGYFLVTSLMNRGSGYMENALRQNFFRAGPAHAGVIVAKKKVPHANIEKLPPLAANQNSDNKQRQRRNQSRGQPPVGSRP